MPYVHVTYLKHLNKDLLCPAIPDALTGHKIKKNITGQFRMTLLWTAEQS